MFNKLTIIPMVYVNEKNQKCNYTNGNHHTKQKYKRQMEIWRGLENGVTKLQKASAFSNE